MNNPLVSIIVPTKNSEATLGECLESIKSQNYKNIEIIVVDNFSTDTTQLISREYTNNFYELGPERCTQRNHGVLKSTGIYIAIIDSDMNLSQNVISSCVEKMESENAVGIIIPEESFGVGFWAQCKKLERSFYVGVDSIEAARFFKKELYIKVGGYDEKMISGEDWDLSDRIEAHGTLGRTNNFIFHNEGHISLLKTLKKKFYYARHFNSYLSHTENAASTSKRKMGIISRYVLFFSNPFKLFKNPFLGLGMLFMKTCEFTAGLVGIIIYR